MTSTLPLNRDVQSLNFRDGIACGDDGAIGDFETLLDDEGEETDDIQDACVAVIKWRDCKLWSVVDLSQFEHIGWRH